VCVCVCVCARECLCVCVCVCVRMLRAHLMMFMHGLERERERVRVCVFRSAHLYLSALPLFFMSYGSAKPIFKSVLPEKGRTEGHAHSLLSRISRKSSKWERKKNTFRERSLFLVVIVFVWCLNWFSAIIFGDWSVKLKRESCFVDIFHLSISVFSGSYTTKQPSEEQCNWYEIINKNSYWKEARFWCWKVRKKCLLTLVKIKTVFEEKIEN